MANFTVLSGNIVSNIIVCDSKEIAEQVTNSICIEYTDQNPAGIGWIYDENTNTFSNPDSIPNE